MEMGLDETLVDWGFGEYLDIFKQNDIVEVDDLKILTKDMVKELIPKVGPRARFMQKLALYNANVIFLPSSRTPPPTNDTSSVALSDSDGHVLSDADLKEDKEELPAFQSESNSSDAIYAADADAATTGGNSSLDKFTGESINLEAILTETNKGKTVLSYYRVNENFDKAMRDKLVEAIIDYETKDNIDQRISADKFLEYSRAIKNLFPSESEDIYFHCSYTNKGYKAGAGKLFRKFYNYRRTLKKCGMLQSSSKESFKAKPNLSSSEMNYSDELQWLKNSTEPWRQVETYWKLTFPIRYDKLKSLEETRSIGDYISEYPALKSSLGYTLLESDFEQLYPYVGMRMYSEWAGFCENIITYAKKRKEANILNKLTELQDENITQDARTSKVLLLLPHLVSTHTLKRKRSQSWRPSKIEVEEGFLIHIKIPGELHDVLERKKQKLTKFGLSLQPTPVIVGPNLNQIEASYVCVDGNLFPVSTPLKAVDVCFKIIHVVHACYPFEAEAIWILLQKAIYKLRTPWDKNLTSVNILLNELGY